MKKQAKQYSAEEKAKIALEAIKEELTIPLKGIYILQDSTLTTKDFYDTKLYSKRHIIERFLSRMKENKRIAMSLIS
jgi:hypothetical protein